MPVVPGDRIGPYEIESELGAGGMGIVYKARDTRLGRVVALKLLPPELTRDEAAKARFVQEAKAASVLDHPSICTLFDIGDTDEGQLYLAMAYYEGETLKQKLARGPLPIADAVAIAIEIAQGLEEAHAAGIVHRDIKPPNVMFGKDGRAKIVDFGLAKLAGQTGPTERGVAMGTVTYMSPEQCSGDKADARSDLWSLGVVLYEMVVGEPPFHGDTYFSVATAIARNAAPALTAKRASVPLELERIVSRALAKDPAERFQTAADFASELRRLQLDMTTGPVSAPVISTPVPAPRSRTTLVLSALVLALVGVVAYLASRDRDTGPRRIRLTNAVQVTSAIGVEDYPTWSPDGSTIAYAANPDSDLYGGNWDVWVIQIGSEPVNRTADYDGDDRFPVWSPDGREIVFWSDRDGGGYFVMSSLGGTPRKVFPTEGIAVADLSRPQWSRDGSELALYTQEDGQGFVTVVSITGGAPRRFRLPPRTRAIDLSWSRDVDRMGYIDAANLSSQVSRVGILDMSSGDVVSVTDGRDSVWSPNWLPGGASLLYVSNREGAMDLWEQPLQDALEPDGPPRALTTGVGMIRAELSPDGTQLAYSRGHRVANLWRVPILADRPATWDDAKQLTFDEAFIEFIDISSDGTRILTNSDRGGNPDLWLFADGEMQQLTSDVVPEWAPRWSPDGELIAYYGFESGNRDVWILPTAGGEPRQLTDDPSAQLVPEWSPDGEEIAFTSHRGGNPDIWVAPAEGGEPRQLTTHPGEDRRPIYSPDGEWIAFASIRSGELRIWRVPAAGGEPEPVTSGPAYYPRWSSDGETIFFIGWAERAGNLWEVSLGTGVERAATDLSGRSGSMGAPRPRHRR